MIGESDSARMGMDATFSEAKHGAVPTAAQLFSDLVSKDGLVESVQFGDRFKCIASVRAFAL